MRALLILPALALATAAFAEDAPTQTIPMVWDDEGTHVELRTFGCGVDAPGLDIAFMTAKDGTSFAAMTMDGMLIPMTQVPSGSGVKYAAIDEQLGYRIHTKGADLLLSQLAADDSAEEKDLYSCTEVVPQ